MDTRISATELARRLGDVLGVPVSGAGAASVREALAAWRAAGTPDPEFAELLERVGAMDRPPDDAWAS